MQINPINNSQNIPEWSVLLYLDGNNDLEGSAVNSLLEIENALPPKDMKVVAQLGRAPQEIAYKDSYFRDNIEGDWSGTRRYDVKFYFDPKRPLTYASDARYDKIIDSTVVEDLKDADFSDSKTLEDFLVWAIKNNPAKHYAFFLADHGDGFVGAFADYKSEQIMPLKDIKTALENTEQKTGIKPDVLVMDGCLMGQVETAYELKNCSPIYIACEDANYRNFPYQLIFNSLYAEKERDGDIKPEEMAKIVVESCAKTEGDIPVISAIKTEKLDILKESIKKLAGALLKTDILPEIIREIINKTKAMEVAKEKKAPYSLYKDFVNFVELLDNDSRITDVRIKEAVRGCISAFNNGLVLDKANAGIIKEWKGERNYNDQNGLSIYLPSTGFNFSGYKFTEYKNCDSSEEIKGQYLGLEFVKETGWDKVLEKFALS